MVMLPSCEQLSKKILNSCYLHITAFIVFLPNSYLVVLSDLSFADAFKSY